MLLCAVILLSNYGMCFSQTTSDTPPSTADLKGSTHLSPDGRLFVWWSGGCDYARRKDLAEGIHGFSRSFESFGRSSEEGLSRNGWNAMIEAGYSIGRKDALTVGLGKVWSSKLFFKETSRDLNLKPSLTNVTLDYERSLVKTRHFSTTMKAGVGYYHAAVDYSDHAIYPGTADNFDATLTGDTLGGELGFGQTYRISHSLSLELLALGRLAKYKKVTSSDFTHNGVLIDDNAPYTLATNDMLGYKLLGFYTEKFVDGQTAQYTPVDFTGFTIDLAVEYHF
jgi:hypothetical protein